MKNLFIKSLVSICYFHNQSENKLLLCLYLPVGSSRAMSVGQWSSVQAKFIIYRVRKPAIHSVIYFVRTTCMELHGHRPKGECSRVLNNNWSIVKEVFRYLVKVHWITIYFVFWNWCVKYKIYFKWIWKWLTISITI